MTAFASPLRLRSRDGREPGRKVTWLELFFDLVFVAAVAQVGEPLAHDYSVAGLGRYAFLFFLIWWAWHGHTLFATRFDTDDVLQRGLTLVQMFAAAAMAVNAKQDLGSRDSAGFAAAYAVMRFVLVAQYLRARRIGESRVLTTTYAAGFGLAATLWLVSAAVPPPVRFWLWGLALAIDFATPLLTSRHLARVPPDGAHLPERFGLFTIILIGEAMVGIMRGMESQEAWPPSAVAAVFLSMVTVFAMWWWYFDGARGAEERSVRTPADTRRFHVWTYAHLPLYLGIAVTGVGLAHAITVAATGHLRPSEAAILCGAVALTMTGIASVAGPGAANAHSRPSAATLRVHYALAAVTALFGGLAGLLPPAWVVISLSALCLVQLAVAMDLSGRIPFSAAASEAT